MHVSKSGAFVGGVAVALVIGGGTAVASSGASLFIGKGNVATATTGLANSKGTPLSLTAKKGTPPLKVNNTVKVKNLDSDLLDGKDSTAFLGKSSTAADSAKLGGVPAANYVGAVYASQTDSESTTAPSSPLLSAAGYFDKTLLPAGSYLVALTADLTNTDATPGEFGCEIVFTAGSSASFGLYGNASINPVAAGESATYGAAAVNQVITLTAPSTAEAYCYVNKGDASHHAYVFNSTLTATRIQALQGSVYTFNPSVHTPATSRQGRQH